MGIETLLLGMCKLIRGPQRRVALRALEQHRTLRALSLLRGEPQSQHRFMLDFTTRSDQDFCNYFLATYVRSSATALYE